MLDQDPGRRRCGPQSLLRLSCRGARAQLRPRRGSAALLRLRRRRGGPQSLDQPVRRPPPAIAATTDDEILAYVREDNHHAPDGSLALAQRLAALPSEWDVNGDGIWSGYLPDVWFDFDAEGFDRDPARPSAPAGAPMPTSRCPARSGRPTARPTMWRSACRRPSANAATATADDAIYALNLAILESLITQADVAIPPTDEGPLGVDLDRDGTLGTATRVAFAFDPRNGVTMSWVGRARDELAAGRVHLAALLFPEGTEFVHSVRYLDVAADGSVRRHRASRSCATPASSAGATTPG